MPLGVDASGNRADNVAVARIEFQTITVVCGSNLGGPSKQPWQQTRLAIAKLIGRQ